MAVGHNGSRVRVDQDDLDPLFAQRAAGLRARIVKLGGLPDNDRAGTNDDNFFNVAPFAHSRSPPIRLINLSNRKPVSSGPGEASGWNCTEKTRPFL